MQSLNYNHLYYFWRVVRDGSIQRACHRLKLTQPTISAQLKELERALGEKLFTRPGRKLELTEAGRMAVRYADDIFSLGQDFLGTIKGRPSGRPLNLVVGIADALPKMIAHRLLEFAMEFPKPVHLICLEGKPRRLLADLAVHALDVVLADTPVPPTLKVRAYSHLLGESGISFLAPPQLARKLSRDFPKSLNDAPFLLPAHNTTLRQSLEYWFDQQEIEPKEIAEFEDNALLLEFGKEKHGVCVVHSAIASDACRQYRLQVVGREKSIRERFYAITVERKIRHPAVVAIQEAAGKRLFT